MPTTRYFTVTQERTIKVAAPSPISAAIIATEAFQNEKRVVTEEGRTTSPILETSVSAREDY